jgi:hypothetical protein
MYPCLSLLAWSPDPIEPDLGSSYLFLRVFSTRTGIHFAGKCSGGGERRENPTARRHRAACPKVFSPRGKTDETAKQQNCTAELKQATDWLA